MNTENKSESVWTPQEFEAFKAEVAAREADELKSILPLIGILGAIGCIFGPAVAFSAYLLKPHLVAMAANKIQDIRDRK